MSLAAASSSLAAELARGVAGLALDLSAQQQRTLLAFVELLGKWNRTYNLTAIREPERMITHHLLDALAVLPHLPPRTGLRVLDVGSGAGIPGLPLAIARPDWQVTLLDANHKKVAFVTQAAIELRLQNVAVHAARVESFAPDAPYDVVISRAFADIATFAGTSAQHVARNGWLVAMKGVHPDAELAEVPAGLRVIATHALRVPGLDAARHLIVMQKSDATEPS
jgi:16S rRNA (guanine527-N7)-methyltransferase